MVLSPRISNYKLIEVQPIYFQKINKVFKKKFFFKKKSTDQKKFSIFTIFSIFAGVKDILKNFRGTVLVRIQKIVKIQIKGFPKNQKSSKSIK